MENASIQANSAVNTPWMTLENPVDLNDKLEALLGRHSESEVDSALGNILGGSVADMIKAMVNGSNLPDFIQDLANEAIDGAVADTKSAGSVEAEEDTKNVFQEVIDNILEQFGKDVNEELEEAGAGSEGEGSSKSGKGGGNWLAVLAKAMGDVAGQHLGNSVRLSEEIAANSTGGGATDAQAQKMAGLQAEMQAETQMFKLAQEATTTIIKSVGEALSSTARKQ